MSDSALKCKYCNRNSFNRCGRCKSVHYCTKVCQTLDWPSHRASCKRSKCYKNDTETNVISHRNKKGLDDSFCKSDANIVESENLEENRNDDVNIIQRFGMSSETNKEKLDVDKEKTGLNPDVAATFENKGDSSFLEKFVTDTSDNSTDRSNGGKKKESPATNQCGCCKLSGCLKICSRCKETFYCSAECQRNDWNQHKRRCKKALSEEDERILKCWKRKEDHVFAMKELEKHTRPYSMSFQNYTGPGERFSQTLTREQALLRSTPPKDSLENAIRITKSVFPGFKVVSAFDDIPEEFVYHYLTHMGRWNDKFILVAFMYRYHEHAMRHGVYLKDENDKESKVEFYLDRFGDNPFPYFTYSQVKPGGYICLTAPVMHKFVDGTYGIRIDSPNKVRVLDINDVMSTVEH